MAKRQKHDEGNADAKTGLVRANVQREPIQSEEFVSLYVNDTQVQVSPWDIRFIFGLIDDPPSSERPTVRIKMLGEVRMSPQHAKRVAAILQQQIKLYEDSVGAIPLPD
ncbi:MAG: DUF3467 domain-containing protein [Candidatus Binatia bacterium]